MLHLSRIKKQFLIAESKINYVSKSPEWHYNIPLMLIYLSFIGMIS